jgi:hypothetical protein
MIFELRNQQSARYVPNTAEARKTGKIFKLQRSMDSRYLPNTVVMAQFEVNLISIPHALFSTSFNLINPALAFALPSTNLLDFALHLEELAEVVCRNCAADVALLGPIWGFDCCGRCQGFCGPLARLVYKNGSRGGVCDGEVGG